MVGYAASASASACIIYYSFIIFFFYAFACINNKFLSIPLDNQYLQIFLLTHPIIRLINMLINIVLFLEIYGKLYAVFGDHVKNNQKSNQYK